MNEIIELCDKGLALTPDWNDPLSIADAFGQLRGLLHVIKFEASLIKKGLDNQ